MFSKKMKIEAVIVNFTPSFVIPGNERAFFFFCQVNSGLKCRTPSTFTVSSLAVVHIPARRRSVLLHNKGALLHKRDPPILSAKAPLTRCPVPSLYWAALNAVLYCYKNDQKKKKKKQDICWVFFFFFFSALLDARARPCGDGRRSKVTFLSAGGGRSRVHVQSSSSAATSQNKLFWVCDVQSLHVEAMAFPENENVIQEPCHLNNSAILEWLWMCLATTIQQSRWQTWLVTNANRDARTYCHFGS